MATQQFTQAMSYFRQSQAVGCRRYTLEDLGRIECRPVTTQAQSRQWCEILDAEHELGAGPLVGHRLRYLVHSEKLGIVGALAFSAAARRLAPRDRFVGWDEATRKTHLQSVICNSRFLIRPHVRVPDLASHALAHCLRRLPEDWVARHGWAPALVETFVDRSRHRGGCYRASNWRYVGDTRGRGRNDRAHAAQRTVKAIYVYPLGQRWRRALGVEHAPEVPHAVDDWACHEFAHALLWDQRLHRRIITLSRDLAGQSTASLPQACGTRAKTKAAYRLFDHPRVTMKELLDSHRQATTARCRRQPVVLAVQDTTSLNYTQHTGMHGLGPISTARSSARGLIVHDTLAFTPEGTPLGVLDAEYWARSDDLVSATRAQRPTAAKESAKWQRSHARATELMRQCPETRVVSVADREGDLYELLQDASRPDQADVLVRAHHVRRRLEAGEGEPQTLIERLQACPMAGHRNLAIPRRGKYAARTACMAVRHATVTLQPPRNKAQLEPVTLYAVHTTEIDPPDGVKPLDWLLLTSVPTETFDQACQRLAWYATCWQIEVYHRTLKSGCRIEDRQLAATDRLENCLAVDLVVAWRVFLLAKQGREQPEQPCSTYFQNDEWKALLIRTETHPDPQPEDEPTLHTAMRLVAGLGGFLGRKGDGEPGTQTLWRGLQRLDESVRMYRIMQKTRAPP